MICPNCQHDNPKDAKFCNECGQKLIAKCPHCGQENPPGSKFCNECGTRLEQPPQPKPRSDAVNQLPISNLQSLIPTDFAAKLETARTQKTMVGERRIVTMLFCDVKGSTAAAGQLDPEDWAQIMNGVFEYMIRPVYKYEGTVARLMGDAILAFFGAPVAHEDDPQRAILAGMEIVEGFKPYQDQIEKDWKLEINVRIGINTGLVMVGAVGSDLQMEYTALGDAINLAARMEQTATPGTVQVSEDTYKLVAPVFEWIDLGMVEVKGKEKPIQTYRPIQPKSQPGRLRGIEGLDAPMVGRDAELKKIYSAIQGLEQGIGSIVFVTGEAGLGKSRLLSELKAASHNSSVTTYPQWHEVASFSYETTQPYALFQRLVRRVCGVEEGDSPAEMWEKLLPVLNLIPADVSDQGGVFEVLFTFRAHSSFPVPEGEAFKRQVFDLMERIWRRWTDEAPRVFVFDDLHWADLASVELLTHLFKLTDTCPVVIICATRPDRESPGWSAKDVASKDYSHRFDEVSVRPLTAEDTNTLVDKLLTISDLPAKLRNRILEKTDGNPFFIEEVVRTLIDNGMVVREENRSGVHWRAVKNIEDIDIPGNLQSLLIARIDKLEDSARRTLQLASVIGRSFYFRVLEEINRAIVIVQDELDKQLTTLQRAELIREAARVPELEYIFRHSLTQEAAYSTILLRQRREFHRQVGVAIENLFPDRVEEFSPVLGHHFGEANDPRVVRYEIQAGNAAFRLFAIPEALGHYSRAVSHLKLSKGKGWDRDQVRHLYLRQGRCYELQNEFSAALEAYQMLIDLGRESKDAQMELDALQARGVLLAIPTPIQNGDLAQSLAEQAMGLAQALGDRKAEAKIEWIFMLVRMYGGRMAEAIPFGERSAELARKSGFQEELSYALQDLSLAYMAVGQLQKAHDTLEEAAELWRLSNNFPLLAENRANMVFSQGMMGHLDEAMALSEEAIRISEKAGNLWGQGNARVFVGLAPLARGDVDRMLEIHETGTKIMRKVGHPGEILSWAMAAWLYETLGEDETVAKFTEEAASLSVSFKPFHAVSLAMRARIKIRAGKVEEANRDLEEAKSYPLGTLLIIDILVQLVSIESALTENALDKALEQIKALDDLLVNSKTLYFVPELGALKARWALRVGESDMAVSILQEACQVAEAFGATNFLWPLQVSLGKLSYERGDVAEAEKLFDLAQQNVRRIMGMISDTELRSRYGQWAEKQIVFE